MKMDSTSLAVSLMVTLLFHSAVAVPTNVPSNLKLHETPNKYASPQLYLFGGYDETKNGSARYLSSASQFNSSNGIWEATTRMSTARNAFCGAVVGTQIYLFGGKTYGNEPTETAEIYDSETGIYSPFRSMSSPRSGCGAAVFNGFIYVAGGHDGSANLNTVIRYDIRTNRRANVSSMQNARAALQLVELNSRLYAIGGQGTKTVEAYNPTSDRWSSVASTHQEYSWFGAAVHEGKIYVSGNNGFEVYSPEADEWQTLTPPNDYFGTKLVSMNGKLWALGGNTWRKPATKSVYTYNISTNKWSQRANMDVARQYCTAFVVNH